MADFVFEQCLPSARVAEIQDLFSRAGQPGFASVYERVYRARERSGLRSWVGLEGGRAVLHISLTIEPFAEGGRIVTAGLPGDLMADESHRQFWHPVKLVRRMVADARAAGGVDFLLTSFTPAAEGIFRAAGFQRFATLARFVMPLVWPYPVLRRIAHGERRPRLTPLDHADARMERLWPGLASPGAFRAIPSPEFYRTRMPRQEYPAGTWLLAGDPESPDAAVLVSPKSREELSVADIVWREPNPRLAGVFSAVARWAARAGHSRLTMMTVDSSGLAAAARRAGFLARQAPHVVMLLSLRESAEIPGPERWAFTPFVLTSW